jgi:type I restriction enzyme S subunit
MKKDKELNKLDDLIDIKHGFAFKSRYFSEEKTNYVVLTPGNFHVGGGFKSGKFKYYDGEINEEFILNGGDLLVTMTDLSKHADTLGYPAIIPSDNNITFLHNQRLGLIKIKDKKKLDKKFLYYLLCTKEYRHEVLSSSTGTTVKHTSPKRIGNFEFFLPPLLEQRAIAHILGTLDDKIELNRRMNETLESIARAIFKSWFVDFDPVHAKAEGRDPGLPPEIADLFPDSFQDSELGRIPKGWEVGLLDGFVTVTKGRSYKSAELQDSDTALVTLKSFERGGGYRPDGLKPYTGPYKSEQVVKPGELVIAQTDVTQRAEVIGKPALVPFDNRYNTLVASLDTAIVRPQKKGITIAFLYYLFRTERFQSHTYSHSSGTTVLHLSKEALPSYQFAIPPEDINAIFDSVVSSMFHKMTLNAQESNTLVPIRNTLLPKLISGELRIPDADKFVKGAEV